MRTWAYLKKDIQKITRRWDSGGNDLNRQVECVPVQGVGAHWGSVKYWVGGPGDMYCLVSYVCDLSCFFYGLYVFDVANGLGDMGVCDSLAQCESGRGFLCFVKRD